MKDVKWQGIGFFLLLFLLAIGLSYLAFNENSSEEVEADHEMRIALVNEDEGALFNENRIVFGNDFATSVNNDSRHDWYVVSRGVAESGFDRNVYDMMIVIPNNFSEKSLSIHLDKPEPVSLHYKINATGHEDVRAEAEKTAGKILNDFNKRLIDVYFASIIGNLQDAQDNIGDIIDKEVDYHNEYNELVHSPLENFTNQFEQVSNYTDNSIESYKGLESVLDNFGESLADGAADNQDFASEMDSVIQQKEDSSSLNEQFTEYFDQFVSNMNDGDVKERIAQIERKNEQVQDQFKEEQDGDKGEGRERASSQIQQYDNNESMATQAKKLESSLEKRLEKIKEIEEEIEEQVEKTVEEKVDEGLGSVFSDKGRIIDLYDDLDRSIKDAIQEEIRNLPTLDNISYDNYVFDNRYIDNINEVIDISNEYIEEFDLRVREKEKDPLTEKLRDKLKNGIVVTDKIENVQDYDREESNIEVNVPSEFSYDMYINDSDPETIGIELMLKLKEDADINIFDPVDWTWEVHTDNEEREKSNDDSNTTSENTSTAIENDDQNNKDQLAKAQDKDTEQTNEEEDTDKDSDETKSDDNEEQQGKEETQQTEEVVKKAEEQAPIQTTSDSETITITNHYYKQEVQSKVEDDITEQFIDETADMVAGYYTLQGLFDVYFGELEEPSGNGGDDNEDNGDDNKHGNEAARSKKDRDEEDEGNGDKLVDRASKDSLYYLLYEENIEDKLKEELSAEITKELKESFKDIRNSIKDYKQKIERTSTRSDNLVKTISKTRGHAEVLNSELDSLLSEVDNWHKTSQDLVESQTDVLNSDQDMNTAIMTLDSDFQPLLASSESLKEQSQANFDSADQVYQTFDAIDQEANDIQESGIDLVNHAGELAEKFTEKTVEDRDFADNFNDVLANSRVGDRQNEDLYSFLANPVHTKNDGVVQERESFTPYFLVLILSVMTLFTAYVISTMSQRKTTENAFAEDASLMGINMPTSLMTLGVGLVEGLTVGAISFYLLKINQAEIFVWLGIITLLTMTMLLVSTYLLRQLKMVGMFILLIIFSLYLLLTRSLGFQFENSSFVSILRQVSPLQYAENLITNILEGKEFFALLTFIFLAVLTGVGFLLNLLVLQKRSGEEVQDEETAEAN